MLIVKKFVAFVDIITDLYLKEDMLVLTNNCMFSTILFCEPTSSQIIFNFILFAGSIYEPWWHFYLLK